MADLWSKINLTQRVTRSSLYTTYLVKYGETIYDIAAKVLGDPLQWRNICKENKILYPWILPQTLKIPRSK